MQNPHQLLLLLGLTESEIDVYLAMCEGVVRAADIVKTTGRKRPTVYYALDALMKRGLVSKTGSPSEGPFRVEPAERLIAIADEKKKAAHDMLADTVELASHLEAQANHRADKPAVAFYEGIKAVKSVVMESLYCRDKKIEIVSPHKNFFGDAGLNFRKEYIEERVKRKIHTRSLWEGRVDPAFIKKYYTELSHVRIVPEVMRGNFSTTIFLYDDKTLYISSRKNAYCILVTSQEHHDTMRAWFDGLWGASRPHPFSNKVL